MNHFISNTLGMEDPNIIFENKIEEIEHKDKYVSTFMQKFHILMIVMKVVVHLMLVFGTFIVNFCLSRVLLKYIKVKIV